MADQFDAYYTWLGIPPEEQPPDYYRLLAVRRFENNGEVIANAHRQRESHVRSLESGPHGEQANRLLNELAQAGACLLNPETKGAYDRELRNKDAPKLSSSGGSRRPTRPEAPRRPVARIEAAPQPASLMPVESTPFPAASPVASVRQGELIPVDYAVHVPMVYAPRGRPPAPPESSRLVLYVMTGLAALAVLLVVGIGLAWGAYVLATQVAKAPRPPGPVSLSPGRVGEPEKKSPPPANPPASRDSPIASTRIALVSKSAGGKPAAKPGELQLVVDDPVDPLAGFDPRRDVLQAGCMVQDGNGWSPSGKDVYEAMYFPGTLPAEYVLETTLTLQGQSQGIIQGLVAGGTQCHITVDGFDGEKDGRGIRTALETIDGRRPHDVAEYPCARFGSLLKPGRPANLRYVVLKNRILVECDGQIVLDWNGGMHRVSPHGLFARGPRDKLYWGTWQTKCRLSNVVLKPIVGVVE